MAAITATLAASIKMPLGDSATATEGPRARPSVLILATSSEDSLCSPAPSEPNAKIRHPQLTSG
jgi:hypothetical protein